MWFDVNLAVINTCLVDKKCQIYKRKMVAINENAVNKVYNGEYSIMVSSSVHGFETELELIDAFLTQLGLNVVMSKSGTLKVNPRLGNFENCLKAVEECDLFLGIIRQNCGTGVSNSESITFKEFKRARECEKPCWYIIESKIENSKELLRSLEMREHPNTHCKLFNWIVSFFYNITIRMRRRMPRVLDMFRSGRTHTFDEECLKMEDFVNQKWKNRAEVTNNWMQYCNSWREMERFLYTNFADRSFIEKVLM